MAETADHLPEDAAALKAALIETRAKLSGAEALIAHLQLTIEKMKRAMFGPRSERSQRLIDQLELQLEELAAAAGEDEAKAEAARVHVQGFTRRPGTRRNFPADLPRRRIVHPAPTSCPCCGGSKLSKIGEDVTETLDVIPRQWFVTEHVREKFSCRSCETITQPPAPFHAIARGFAGPSLLAMMLVEKYANHQPLNRQSEQYAREGIELSVSTMADHVGACAATLTPLYELIKAHVFAAERIHGDDTTVPVLAKTKTRTGRIWTYVRDDRPFGGDAPPAAVFFYSPDRAGLHPERHLAGYSGILQADAYSGFNKLYEPDRKPGLLVRELEGPDDDLCLAVAHDTSPVRLGEDQLEFIFRERRIVGDAVPHAVDNPGRHSLENPQQRPSSEMGNAEGTREKKQVSLGASDGEELGDLFSNEDVQHRHQEERDRDPPCMEESPGLIVGGEVEADNSLGRALGDPAHRQASSGDFDLRQREIVADAIDNDNRLLGCLDALAGQLLQAGSAHADDRELRHNPHAVEQYQRQRRKDCETSFQHF